MKKTFIVPEFPDAKRTSDVHDYTHVTVGMWNVDAALIDAKNRSYAQDGENHDYYMRMSKAVAGELEVVQGTYKTSSYPIRQETIDIAKAFIEQHGTDRFEFMAACKARAIERLEKQKESLAPAILQWHRTHAAAVKAAGTFRSQGYRNVHILEAFEQKKPVRK